MRESDFQKKLKAELKKRFPGCYVLKQDPSTLQGIPDLLILYKDKWAMLECKREVKSTRRPNQGRRVDAFNKLSFAAFIYPENKDEVLDALEQTFRNR